MTQLNPVARDTVWLRNGTQIVGEVISIREGEIRFDPADFGDVVIKLRHVAQIVTGLSTQRERATDGRASPIQIEIPLSVKLTLFRLVVPDLMITSHANGYKSLAQAGRYRLDYELTILYEVISNLYINQQFFFNYDQRPPVPNVSNSDYGAVISLTYQF